MVASLTDVEVEALAAEALGVAVSAIKASTPWRSRGDGRLFHCINFLLAVDDALMELEDEADLWAYLCGEASTGLCLTLKALIFTAKLKKDDLRVVFTDLHQAKLMFQDSFVGHELCPEGFKLWPLTILHPN